MKRPTIRDIARISGHSVSTVSKALNFTGTLTDETRATVLKCAEEIGYVRNFMASHVRRNKSRLIGILVSDLSQPFFSQVLSTVEQELTKAGYQTLLFNSSEDPAKEVLFIRQLVSLGAAGCLIDLVQNTSNSVRLMKLHQMPYVLFGRRLKENEDNYVVPDNRQVGYEAAMHLLRRLPGRPIVCVNGPDGISPTTERYEGFLRALNEVSPGARPARVFDNCFDLEGGYEAGREAGLLVPGPFSAFCSTDRLATGFLRGVYECGLSVPGDVRLASVDDIDAARYIIPSLTTVSLPKREMAAQSAHMLMKLIDRQAVSSPRIVLNGELIVRESS